MDSDSKYIHEPTFSFKALAQPRIILTAWFVGFWFALAIVYCIVDYRMTRDPFDKVSDTLYLIGYHTCLAQMLCMFCLGFFATHRHWLSTPFLSIAGVLATLAIFRIFITPYKFEPWVLYQVFPAMFAVVCLIVSLFTHRRTSEANPLSALQLSIVDAFLLVFIMACFFALMKIAIFDLSFAFRDDLRKMWWMVNPYPELFGRILDGAFMAIFGLTYISLTKLKRTSWGRFLITVAVILLYAAIHSVVTLLVLAQAWGGTATNVEHLPLYFWNALFTSAYFYLYFAVSIALFRKLQILPNSGTSKRAVTSNVA